MALDVYLGGARVLALDAAACAVLDAAQATLRARAGVAIDPYGRTLLYPDHARLLAAGLRAAIAAPATPAAARRAVVALAALLERAAAAGEAVRFEGD